jgi:hypothetical protein
MNAIALLRLPQSMVQRGAVTHKHWRGYITVLVANHGLIFFISIVTLVNRPKIQCDVDIPLDCVRQELHWNLTAP